ncbi:hypothetical protein Phi18:2_gp63 [Cellulophaga phage phi18:2]|uniref:Lipoprotein n=2 Tax=Cellulophaga phage phi18:1 TaxID=1327982 RepID=S0A1F2_9CAUD|nr:hypothetical protein Phi18:1_gp65 [Cellulophaga phage phi18:1]AGO48512.1 hypothetical protein Phi18:1_gp65 [Cellulophaga phage phi18:1]AGO49226.1 hypothetical protein Phi18:2_gp63 [Cellulophaga phage phi18:2]
MKRLSSIFLILILVTSCGTRKREVDKQLILEARKEVLKDNGTITTETKYNKSEIVLEAVDTSKPIKVDGKVYENAKVTIKKDSGTTTDIEVKDLESTKTENIEVRKKVTNLETSNKIFYTYGFIFAIIILILIVAYLKIKKYI